MVPKDVNLISRFILHCWSYFAIISTWLVKWSHDKFRCMTYLFERDVTATQSDMHGQVLS